MEHSQVGDVVMEWVYLAQTDIWVAETTLNTPCNPRLQPLRQVVYHSQQAAEKILKAYLIYRGEQAVKKLNHDLDAIRTACIVFDATFDDAQLIKFCAYLNTFSTARYPDYKQDLTKNHAENAIDHAKRIYDFVSEKLGIGKEYISEEQQKQ
jgi:HEPN domain-containing protein